MRLLPVESYFTKILRSSHGFVHLLPIFVLGFLGLTLLLVLGNIDEEQDTESQAQTPPVTLFLQPSSGNLGLNSDVSVQVRVSTSTEQTNAVQANVSFPTDKFDFVSIDPAGSAFGIEAQAQHSNGTVFIARGSLTPVTGDQLVAKINLRTKAVNGSAILNFAAGSEVVSSQTNQSLPTTLTGGSYTIGQAAAGTISLMPASGSFAQNTEVRVAVRENSGTAMVNAVQANVSYPTDKLDFVSIDTTGTDFPIEAQGSNSGGTVMIARGTTTPVSGDKLIATIVLRTKTVAGQAALTFANGTEVISSQTNLPLTLTQNGATYTVNGATTPPTATPTPTITPTITPTVPPGTATPTPTITPTNPPTTPPTATPTPTNPPIGGNPPSNNGGGGGSSSGPSAPSCNDSAPASAPNLFQIDTTQTTANLHFAPAARPISYYFLSFGFTEGDERFGGTWQQGHSTGALQYKVNFLSPNTTYWFHIRGGNGCMPGAWSKWVKAQTKAVPAPAKKPNVIRRVAKKITQPIRKVVRKVVPKKATPKPKATVRPAATPRR